MTRLSLRTICAVLAAALVFPALLSACGDTGTQQIADLSSFAVSARDYDSASIGPDAVFEILCDASISPKQLEAAVSLTPETGYELKKEKAGVFTLTPAVTLAQNTLYNVVIGDNDVQQTRSWAFQTKREVAVTGSLPGDGSTYVPVDTGIEIYLSHMDLQVDPVFSIEPAVEGSWTRYKKTAVFMPKEPLAPDTLYKVTVAAGALSSFGKLRRIIRFRSAPSPRAANISRTYILRATGLRKPLPHPMRPFWR